MVAKDSHKDQRLTVRILRRDQIKHSEVEAILSSHHGNYLFSQALQHSEIIVQVLSRYVQFNAPFGSGVAGLAGQLGTRRDLFQDPSEQILAFGDKSIEVASHIFSAAVDEFGDRAFSHPVTHRALAKAMLKGIGQYFRNSNEEINDNVNRLNKNFYKEVLRGYGFNGTITEERLFRAIGFHIGSELLADGEFKELDKVLRKSYASLVTYLEKTKICVGGDKLPAYLWIKIHTSVEEDHFANAVKGANLALLYYAGSQENKVVKRQILNGIELFAALQEKFMNSLQGR